MEKDLPIACDLSAIEPGERSRHKQTSEQIFDSVEQVRELAAGYAFQLPAKTNSIENAAAFIARERLCCLFFTFNLVVTPSHGPVWLEITGKGPIKQFVKENIVQRLA